MPKIVIDREITGVGALSHEELQMVSQNSRGVLNGMGPKIHWVQSHVTDDKIYCMCGFRRF